MSAEANIRDLTDKFTREDVVAYCKTLTNNRKEAWKKHSGDANDLRRVQKDRSKQRKYELYRRRTTVAGEFETRYGRHPGQLLSEELMSDTESQMEDEDTAEDIFDPSLRVQVKVFHVIRPAYRSSEVSNNLSYLKNP